MVLMVPTTRMMRMLHMSHLLRGGLQAGSPFFFAPHYTSHRPSFHSHIIIMIVVMMMIIIIIIITVIMKKAGT